MVVKLLLMLRFYFRGPLKNSPNTLIITQMIAKQMKKVRAIKPIAFSFRERCWCYSSTIHITTHKNWHIYGARKRQRRVLSLPLPKNVVQRRGVEFIKQNATKQITTIQNMISILCKDLLSLIITNDDIYYIIIFTICS